MFWKKYYPTMIIGGLWTGLVTQFVWKIVYFPEPLIPVIGELTLITTLGTLAVWGMWK